MHERHAQHVGMHVVESVELIHGSAVLQSTHLDQIRALCDVCATCAASRTIAHSSCGASRNAAAAAYVGVVAACSAVTTVVRQPQPMARAFVG